MPEVAIPTPSGRATGYLTTPAGGQAPAAIVLQEWWRVDGHIRSVCDRLAAEGFYALAPELRSDGPAENPSAHEQTALSLPTEDAAGVLRGVADHLLSMPGVRGPGVAVIGFGFGGGLALSAAAAWPQISASVIYYSLTPHGKPAYARIKGPVLGHFGTADIFITLKDAKALETEIRDAGVDVFFEKYTGAGHGFFNDNSHSAAYDAPAADRSWRRTIEFLQANLADPNPQQPA